MRRLYCGWSFWTMTLLSLVSVTTAVQLMVDTRSSIFKVDPEFLSVTLDFQMIVVPPEIPRWYTFDTKNPRVLTLLRGLSPCYLRFGGTQADMTVLADSPASVLYNLPTPLRLNTIYPSDIDKLVELTRATGCQLFYDLNLSLRYGSGWDPTNTLRILNHMVSKGYGENIHFQLGNEPDFSNDGILPAWPWPPGATQHEVSPFANGSMPKISSDISGKQIGEDYIVLKKLLKVIPNFSTSKLVGADIASQQGLKILMPDFLRTADWNITATTFHHYYFKGLGAAPSQYIDPEIFVSLVNHTNFVKDLVKENSPRKDLPVWLGETADSWHSGTQNISDRYISGFLWLEKLGMSAQLGIGVVMRQTFYGGFYGLIDGNLYPNPDYWVSFLHKHLVGRTVLNTYVQGSSKGKTRKQPDSPNNIVSDQTPETEPVRLYAHCTKASTLYPEGAITIFGINVKNQSETVTFDPPLANQKVDQYLLTPVGPDGLLSKVIAVNGKALRLVDDFTFLTITPVTLPTALHGLQFPALSMAFWVFPDANISICSQE